MLFGIEYKFWWLVLFIIAFCFVPFLYFWYTQDKWQKEGDSDGVFFGTESELKELNDGERFETYQESIENFEARKTRKRLIDFIAELNNGQKPDFTGAKQGRYWMLLDHEDKMVYLKDFHSFQIASKDLVFFNPDHLEDIRDNFTFEELEMALNA